jgi:hypothetical protein
VSDAKDAGYLDKDVSTDEGLDILSKTRLRAKETTRAVPTGIATGTTSLPQTFKLATDESGRRAVDLSTSNVPIKGNYGGREVDGVIDAVGVNKKGEKVAWVQQDKMIKGKGASRGKMVSSGEKETVEVPYTPILAKELHDKHKINIDWTDAGKSEEQKSEAEKRGL